jgi:hypothetical protein
VKNLYEALSGGRGVRRRLGWTALLFLLGSVIAVAGQSTSATLTGTVVDPTSALLPGANIELVQIDGLVRRSALSTADGTFVIPVLPPGRYVLRASLQGFSSAELRDLVLNVNDRVAVRVEMGVPSRGERVTVTAESQRISSSPAVSTVVDRQFVENLPLSGRSFQALLELTPGVVLTRAGSLSEGGQFSVNGQRTNSNYFTIDGVSANAGIIASSTSTPAQSGSGVFPTLTALGGTNSLVSVDALQEFRIQTSTYAPEFGRTPGGQISLVTRSGSNRPTGSVFEYFRDEALDANDWFANRIGGKKPDLLQHDFGGVLGGPLVRNRTFAFGSYEGLRLRQPTSKSILVPSIATRQNAPPALQPLLNVFPIPNGPDRDGGLAEYLASYSDESRFDSTSVRVDHKATDSLSLFGRAGYAPSYTRARGSNLANVATSTRNNTTGTLGTTWVVSNRLVHDFRINYSENDAPFFAQPDGFGGGTVPPQDVFHPDRSPDLAFFSFVFNGASWSWGTGTNYVQRQMNAVHTLALVTASHDMKFGVDYLRTTPLLSGRGGRGTEIFNTNLAGLAQSIGNYSVTDGGREPLSVLFSSLSVFAQDNWKPVSRLTVTYGLRWEFVPTVRAVDGPNAVTLNNIDDPYGGHVSVATRDTPLWRTRYNNIAPRVGASVVLSDAPGAQLILRGGFGIFYDLGFGQVASAYRLYPFFGSKNLSDVRYPFAPSVLQMPSPDPPVSIVMMDPQLRLPFTYQWNASVERALGTRQTFSIGYVAADGRRLLRRERYNINLVEWPTTTTGVFINKNQSYSDYRSVQFQFQRRLHRGLQAVVSYTFGRSRDTASSDAATGIPAERIPPALDYGYSDFDVRHVFSSAVTYQMPELTGSSLWRSIAGNWGFDVMVRARSGYPINIGVNVPFPPDTETARPNVVPGQSFWFEDSTAPGGRRLNGFAFSRPAANTQGDLPRGLIRGFNARQVDAALRREIRLSAWLRLQLRFEMFNLLNTPNFADPAGVQLGSLASGTSSQMLGRSLGGLSPLYQIGGPRSTQIAAKLLF